MNKLVYNVISICLYVLSFVLISVAALFFAVSNNLYWLFLVLGLLSLYGGLTLKYFKEKKFGVKNIESKEEVKELKPFFKRTNVLLLLISLGVVICAGFFGHIGETCGFKIEVSDFTLTKEMTVKYNQGVENAVNGHNYVIATDDSSYGVTMFKPKSASSDNQLPVVFVIPGFTRTKATMAQYGLELARRGAVVFIIDPGCQGATTAGGYNEDGSMVSSTAGANGAEYLVQYVYNNKDDFDFIDRDRFGVVGHSAGGGNAVSVAADFAGGSFEKSIIKALYCSGYIKTSAANKYASLRCNAAMSYAYYDEGAFRYQTATTSYEVIAQRFVNEVNGVKGDILRCEEEKEYGSMDNGTYRVVHHEMTNHCFEMYDNPSVANTIDFFNVALKMGSSVKGTSQVWYFKEAFTLIAMVGGFVFFVSLACVLLDTKFFSGVKSKKVERPVVSKPKSVVDNAIFWSSMILTAIIACLDYIPLANLSIKWFPDAASNTYTFFFPARMVNAILLWAAINGLIGLVIFFGINLGENLVRFIRSKINPEYVPEYSLWKLRPLKVGIVQLLKTILLAAIVFCGYYALIYFNYYVFHTDFRFLLISGSVIAPRYWVVWLEYFPIIFIFYISNSIRVNLSIGFENWKEWQVKLVGALANSLGLVFILVINYFCYFKTGTVYYGYYGTNEVWLYINMVFGLIPMMFILPILNRIFYNKTNQPYLGGLVCCAIFIMMTLTASVAYIPL